MSKSLGNYIGVSEVPDEMFGKLMSISDELMWRYFDLLSLKPQREIAQFKVDVEKGANPRDIKFLLAEEIITRYHDKKSAVQAKENFIARFRSHELPDDLPEVEIEATEGQIGLAHLLKQANLVASTSEAFRMVDAQAVKIDGARVEDKHLIIKKGSSHIYQVGKRKFARIKIS